MYITNDILNTLTLNFNLDPRLSRQTLYRYLQH